MQCMAPSVRHPAPVGMCKGFVDSVQTISGDL